MTGMAFASDAIPVKLDGLKSEPALSFLAVRSGRPHFARSAGSISAR
jgi:hypothetical protein